MEKNQIRKEKQIKKNGKNGDYKTMLFDDDGYSTRRGICRLVGVPPGREKKRSVRLCFLISSSTFGFYPKENYPHWGDAADERSSVSFFSRKTLLAGRNVWLRAIHHQRRRAPINSQPRLSAGNVQHCCSTTSSTQYYITGRRWILVRMQKGNKNDSPFSLKVYTVNRLHGARTLCIDGQREKLM